MCSFLKNYEFYHNKTFFKKARGWECSSVVEHLPSIKKALGSIPIQHYKKKKKKKEKQKEKKIWPLFNRNS
jgi:hypothetical protein